MYLYAPKLNFSQSASYALPLTTPALCSPNPDSAMRSGSKPTQLSSPRFISFGARNWQSAEVVPLQDCTRLAVRRFEPRKPRKHRRHPRRIPASVKIGCEDLDAPRKPPSPPPATKPTAPGLPNSPVSPLRGILLPLRAQIELPTARILRAHAHHARLMQPHQQPQSRFGYALPLKPHATQPVKV